MARNNPPIYMQRNGSSLVAVSQIDMEFLQRYAEGSTVEVITKQRRSIPQHRRYWVALGETVLATGGNPYPTASHLHEALKMALGYVQTLHHLSGRITAMPDSTAFSAMDQAAFKVYFDNAMRLIAERFGFDPLAIERAA